MSEADRIISDLVGVVGHAIARRDWQVDGACDPDLCLDRARRYLERQGYDPEPDEHTGYAERA